MRLSVIASTQPHAAYAAFTHGLSSHWTYNNISRTIPNIQDLLRSLEIAIHQHFIPALTGREPCSVAERDLLALPARLGGLGLTNPTSESAHLKHPKALHYSITLQLPLWPSSLHKISNSVSRGTKSRTISRKKRMP